MKALGYVTDMLNSTMQVYEALIRIYTFYVQKQILLKLLNMVRYEFLFTSRTSNFYCIRCIKALLMAIIHLLDWNEGI